MNNERRKDIDHAIERLKEAKEILQDVCEQVDVTSEEEQEYLDNIPENLSGSERYEIASEACENLNSAFSALEELSDNVDEIEAYLEAAK
ncbi:putative solute-binding protein [Lachnospiraceae bacterium PF1-22]